MSENDLYGDSVYEQGGQDPVDDVDDLDPVSALTGDDPDEVEQTRYVPPDREPYNMRHAPTPAEEREGESLDDKLAEEVPDISPDDPVFDEEQPRAGRLVDTDYGALEDTEKDEVAIDVGPAGFGSSAEEAAVHIIDEDEVDYR
jgi:hypothetical protein